MKKIGLFLLVVMMALGMAACSKNKDADPVGTWVMSYAWNTGGSGSVVWHIYAKGDFNTSSGNHGTWAVSKKDITMSYDNGTTYGGEVDDDRMSGTMTSIGSGTQGIWSAQRTSTSP
jgi:hypothetical protein